MSALFDRPGGTIPTGTVTFLFTDIEGSTKLAQQYPENQPALLSRHHTILRESIQACNGYVFQIIGDAFCAAFHTAPDALKAAWMAQRLLQHEEWYPAPILVRMGIHTGVAQASILEDGSTGYRGYLSLARVQSVMSSAHGGQVLLSNTSAELIQGQLPQDVTLRNLGEHHFKSGLDHERLWQLVASDLRIDFPPLKALKVLPNNLPEPLDRLIGRERDLVELQELLTNTRLLTLAGPGGIGKTRLAIAAAENLLPAFPQGAWFVPLAPLASPEFLAEAIGAALELSFSGQVPPAEQLLESLRRKELLLVLDNFEHLLPQGTQLLVEILHKAPGVKLLVTSRERLNLQAEWILEVQGLEYPKKGKNNDLEDYPAAALFLQHARRAAGAPPPDEDKVCVAHITRLVEGAPLALELAAAWARALSCREIAGEIEQSLSFLQSRQPDLPERHRSMQAVFDYSWQLLSDQERSVFRKLSVFRGGFERQAAGQVAGASLASLAALVDKSLLHHNPDGRYRLHELLRQFAAEELESAGETGATREKHLAYYLGLAEQAGLELWRADEKTWLDRLETELDNLRVALEWSLSPQSELGVQGGLRLVLAIEPFWMSRGHFIEATGWLARLLVKSQATEDRKLYADGLRLAAWLDEWFSSKVESGRAGYEQALVIAEAEGDRWLLAKVLSDFGNFQMNWGDLIIAEAFLERSLSLYQELGDEPGIATVIRRLGHIATIKKDLPGARSFYQQSLQVWRALGNRTNIAWTLRELGSSCWRAGQYAEARPALEESLKLSQVMNDQWAAISVLSDLGLLEYLSGEITRSISHLEESLELARVIGLNAIVASSLYVLGEIARYQNDDLKALAFYQEALGIYQETGQTVDQEKIFVSEASIYLRKGDLALAREFINKSQLIRWGYFRNIFAFPLFLISLAGLAEAGGDMERATRLLGSIEGLAASMPIPLSDIHAVYSDYERILAQVQTQLEDSAFNQLLEEGRAMAVEGVDHILAYAQKSL